MDKFDCRYLPYQNTRQFSQIVRDFLNSSAFLRSFYLYDVDRKGIVEAIESRKQFMTDRALLVEHFRNQYKELAPSGKVADNIEKLQSENTFTICTAHQPNIFTGHLYFIYKILHVIKLAEVLKHEHTQYDFVPVFFLGSEDADLEELNHVVIEGKKYTWETNQTGAVGNMLIDQELIDLIGRIEGTLSVQPHGPEIVDLMRQCYQKGRTIEDATFRFVHKLFENFGLLVFLPNSNLLKKAMLPVFKDDLFNHTPGELVQATSDRLNEKYTPQAFPRKVNLFYLKDNIRNRIEKEGDRFGVVDTDLIFTAEEIKQELQEHSDRFSPNVILRGLYQETVLPNIGFVGGGGELAYWLQLKDLFNHYHTPFPMLILRNSFLIIEKKWQALQNKLNLSDEDLFRPGSELFEAYVKLESSEQWKLNTEIEQMSDLYKKLLSKTVRLDAGLERHVPALETQALNKLRTLEKKLFRSQKKKFEAVERQIHKLLDHLAPENGLQERSENFMTFYARWGREFLHEIHRYSLTLEQEFTILKEKEG